MVGAACEAGRAYPSGPPDVTPGFMGVRIASALVFFLCDVLFPISSVIMCNLVHSVRYI